MASLRIKPGQHVLEIGCGPGVAASYVCEALGSNGCYLGIDRSPTAIRMAEKRNAAYIKNGIARFEQQVLETLELGGQTFDIIFAIRVGYLYRHPVEASTILKRYLKPGGVIRSVYDTPD